MIVINKFPPQKLYFDSLASNATKLMYQQMKTVICRSNHTCADEKCIDLRTVERLWGPRTLFLNVLWVDGYDTEWREFPQLVLAAENDPFWCAQPLHISAQPQGSHSLPMVRKLMHFSSAQVWLDLQITAFKCNIARDRSLKEQAP